MISQSIPSFTPKEGCHTNAEYAVLGNPIQHSKSPVVHRLFSEQTKQSIQYSTILVQDDPHLAQVLTEFQTQGGKGVNITMPFKQSAYALVDEISERAELAGAINTICFRENGTRFADNTDGIGFITDIIHNQKIILQNKKILILGAGGAVRGILKPLLDQNPALVVVANRTDYKALELATSFVHYGNLQASSLFSIPEHSFDVIINSIQTSSISDFGKLPACLITENTFCYDMNYGNSAFLQWTKQHGVILSVDGLGMLVEQAAESFLIWRGVKPKTMPVISALRSCFFI